jgi:hypothetical protein
MLSKEEINFILRETSILVQEDLSLYCITCNAGAAPVPEQEEFTKLFGHMDKSRRDALVSCIIHHNSSVSFKSNSFFILLLLTIAFFSILSLIIYYNYQYIIA